MARTYFDDERRTFRDAVALPEDARGWAPWKALVAMADLSSPGVQARILSQVLADRPERGARSGLLDIMSIIESVASA